MANEFGSSRLIIYGAGLAGRRVKDYLAAREQPVEAFLDRDERFDKVDGVPVLTAACWATHHDPADACVIVAVFNPYVDMCDIFDGLEALGFGRILSLVEFVRLYPHGQPSRYWLVDPAFYEQHAPRIAALRSVLADDTSKQLLDAIVNYRTSGDPRCLPPATGQQYFPADLPAPPQPLRFIDCGAYVGDTVQAFEEAGLTFAGLATFEPDLSNYCRLTAQLGHIAGAVHIPCGVSDSNRLSGYDPSLGAGGHLVDVGGDPVCCVRLDDALPGFEPNFIKMDIEGEEPAALRGAIGLLSRHRPRLAISVYHRAEHLWEIAEQLQAYGLGYRYYLRCHSPSTFDTVLYALPGES
ncbi:UNVERIFIED_ORG: FkbM family methyltransferase [Pseudomonas parafulva]|uniref:FkbM family methyltransferase n=1 Tax=Pseudomonas TaxID=286 RepID=UPI0020B7DD7C|nr:MULTISPECIES: FkbM family methyltransferase [Pseudomonas]MCP3788729.1 FkbM family methyltransferase [Pseudomonas sp. N2-11]MDH0617958.1 FkbM family methyltransferase [Pseudomonas fulva]MDP9556408.1 FkbM family methyltransferase [Pseudomonas parafulva]